MSGKPLARWTVGPVTSAGMKLLAESVRQFGRCYPEWDRVVCYNHMSRSSLPERLGVDLYEQSAADFPYPLTGPGGSPGWGGSPASGWKLCPPRLRIGARELWLDNDVLVCQRFAELDDWALAPSAGGIISEGLHRIYGVFERVVPSGVKACAGFFGLPPGFDFCRALLSHCHRLGGRSLGHYDEQGLVAAIITCLPVYTVVPLRVMPIIEDDWPLPDPSTPAIHFVGVNRKNWHRSWGTYRRRCVLHL